MVRPKNYDVDGYIHFVEKRTGSFHTIGKDDNVRKMPDKEAYEIPFEQIEKLNLNKVGNEVPSMTRNHWSVDRYMAYYWKQIMDADCIFLWYHLWEYCDEAEGVDMCYPKMSELSQRCGLSRPTLIEKLKKLEQNNFLIQVHRLNKKRGNKEDSPIFKLRRTIPLLSQEQHAKLKPLMKEKHDDYMKKFASESSLEWFSSTGDEIIDDLVGNVGDRMISKKARQEIKSLLKSEQEEEYIMENLPAHIRETLTDSNSFKNALVNNGYSKPSADTFFRDVISIFDKDTNTAHLLVREKSQKEFLEEGLNDSQKDRLLQTLISLYESVYDMRVYTTEQYILKIMKGK